MGNAFVSFKDKLVLELKYFSFTLFILEKRVEGYKEISILNWLGSEKKQ